VLAGAVGAADNNRPVAGSVTGHRSGYSIGWRSWSATGSATRPGLRPQPKPRSTASTPFMNRGTRPPSPTTSWPTLPNSWAVRRPRHLT